MYLIKLKKSIQNTSCMAAENTKRVNSRKKRELFLQVNTFYRELWNFLDVNKYFCRDKKNICHVAAGPLAY